MIQINFYKNDKNPQNLKFFCTLTDSILHSHADSIATVIASRETCDTRGLLSDLIYSLVKSLQNSAENHESNYSKISQEILLFDLQGNKYILSIVNKFKE